jgi:hypothetical protein
MRLAATYNRAGPATRPFTNNHAASSCVEVETAPSMGTTVLGTPDTQEEAVRIGGVIVVIWLLIGVVAAVQRGYFSSSDSSCARAGDTFVTVIAGPLNYIGVNPKIKCNVPQPSQ